MPTSKALCPYNRAMQALTNLKQDDRRTNVGELAERPQRIGKFGMTSSNLVLASIYILSCWETPAKGKWLVRDSSVGRAADC